MGISMYNKKIGHGEIRGTNCEFLHINNNNSNKDVSVMRYVIDQIRRKDKENLLSVVRIEIDYELVTLQDAIEAKDTVEIIKTKERLNSLVRQLKTLL